MKYVKLTQPGYVGGELKLPTDGVLPVEDKDEFKRLTKEEGAEDVTADFAKAKPKGTANPTPTPRV
ncbi:MAG: hypothetical protein J0H88_08425 [Sphingomonadales bacterium]|nr:hypothetical protein [Sphingomonadales bacterium]